MGNQVCRYAMLTRPPGADVLLPPFWAQVELRKCLFTSQPTVHTCRAIAARPCTRERGHRGPSERRCCTAEMFRTAQRVALTPSRLAARARVPLSRCLLRLLPPPPAYSFPAAGKARSPFRLILPATSPVACARALGPYCTAAISALVPA